MAIGTAVAPQPGKHETQAVQQFRKGPKSTADAGDTRALMEGEGSWYIPYLLYVRPFRLGHPAPGVGGKGFQIPPGSFRIQDPQGQGGFPGPGHPGNSHDFVERDVHVDIFQIMDPGPPDLYMVRDGRDMFCAHAALSPLLESLCIYHNTDH